MSRAVYRAPADLLVELGIETPDEIDIDAIAEHCNATVVYEPLAGCAARIIGHGDRAIITVDAGSAQARRRFSTAHELGHWMCDRGRIAFACAELMLVTSWGTDNPERRANRFAAELLMPEKMFKQHARKLEPTLANCRALAKKFTTSLTATALRLVDLGDKVTVAACTERGRLRWVWRPEELPYGLRVRKVPGSATEAAKVARGERCEQGPWEIVADEWFDHPYADEYQVLEDACEITPGVVLSLLWWRDERMLREVARAR